MMKNCVCGIFIVLVVLGCNGLKTIQGAFHRVSPYEAYLNSLEKANLLNTPMARAWVEAGENALRDSIGINLPFAETGFFQAGAPESRSYQFEVKEGQVLTVEGDVKTKSNARIFQDLFVLKNEKWEHIADADSTFSLTYEFKKNNYCLLRIQPELLVDAYYSVNIAVTPVLINPVSGASNKSIGSFYGDLRDGGRRSHEGVDIFAPKGTAVVAPTDGYITRLGNTALGGKVIWMSDRERGHAYYFAHLDSQIVRPGMHVKQGEVLGTVGNTGNARTTPPHLHFGIYQSGSKDPINYIRAMEAIVERLPADTTFQSLAFKVSANVLNLRSGPGEKHFVKSQLAKDAYVRVIGRSSDWDRVALPDALQGYVFSKLVVPAEKGTAVILPQSTYLLTEGRSDAIPVFRLNDSAAVEILAHFQGFDYVRTMDGLTGWVERLL